MSVGPRAQEASEERQAKTIARNHPLEESPKGVAVGSGRRKRNLLYVGSLFCVILDSFGPPWAICVFSASTFLNVWATSLWKEVPEFYYGGGRRLVANNFTNVRVWVSSSIPWAALWNPRGALSPSFHSASKPWSTRSLRRDTSNKQKQDSIPLKSLQTDVVKERRSKVRLEPGSATDIGTHRPCHTLDTNPLSLVWVLPDSSLSLPQVICVVPNFLCRLRIVYALPEF